MHLKSFSLTYFLTWYLQGVCRGWLLSVAILAGMFGGSGWRRKLESVHIPSGGNWLIINLIDTIWTLDHSQLGPSVSIFSPVTWINVKSHYIPIFCVPPVDRNQTKENKEDCENDHTNYHGDHCFTRRSCIVSFFILVIWCLPLHFIEIFCLLIINLAAPLPLFSQSSAIVSTAAVVSALTLFWSTLDQNTKRRQDPSQGCQGWP